jgi:hypothetical protein
MIIFMVNLYTIHIIIHMYNNMYDTKNKIIMKYINNIIQ